MKRTLLIFLCLISNANAQTIVCPKTADGNQLSGYSVFYDKQTELQGEFKKVKGGYTVIMPTKFDYFVCEYGKVKNWQEVKLDPNISSCKVQVKEIKDKPTDIKLVCK